MNIKARHTLQLTTEKTQLNLVVLETGHVIWGYLGRRFSDAADESGPELDYVAHEIARASYMADTDNIKDYKLEQLPLLYPAYGNTDLGMPAHSERFPDGSRVSDFRYESHCYVKEKPILDGLPSAFADVSQTLIVSLKETISGDSLQIILTAYPEYDVYTQSVSYHRKDQGSLKLEELTSLNLSFLRDDFDLLTLSGAWGRENEICRRALVQGVQGLESRRGASGHGQNSFFCLCDPEVTEDHGDLVAGTLLYSGNFKVLAQVDMHQNTRVQLGIQPDNFSWHLEEGESFTTPEAVFMSCTDGLDQMSRRFHRFFSECVIRSSWKKRQRPVLINNWEATYFDFDKQTLCDLAEAAVEVGVELFVLDDGWFGQRNDDTSSLGDWFPNVEKLGGSLQDFIHSIKKKGLLFGLWLEPEMISENSRLYQEHPDWVIQVPGRNPQAVRNQFVLDLSRSEIQDYLISILDTLLTENDIDYIKWDMNRNLTDLYSPTLTPDRQLEISHRYILGLYRILEEITHRHPQVLFESCAGGGGRFDGGMLFYMPQIWTSDDTDAIARLNIQKGTALVYPPAAMGCHISAVPNHQVGRITSMETRNAVAQQGNFGLELNLLTLSEAEKAKCKELIAVYKENRQILQFGEQSRLKVYDEVNEAAWQKIGSDGEVIVTHINILNKPNTVPKRLRLKHLDFQQRYRINGDDIRSGGELMQIGLMIPPTVEDFVAVTWTLHPLSE